MHRPLAFVRPSLLLSALLAGCTDTPGGGDDPPPPTEPEPGDALRCRVDATCGGGVLDDPRTPCQLVIRDGDETVYEGAAGLELRGRSSLAFPKPQYAVELRDWSELPVWPGATWSYTDDAPDGFEAPGFDDGGWRTGPAPLGWGGGYLQTELPPQRDASPTTWFRTTFTPAGKANIQDLELGLDRHDGAVVWLNGTEVYRAGLPDDATGDDPADAPAAVTAGSRWTTVDVDPDLLVDGENVLAVELHRAVDAPELRFDVYLEGSGDGVDVDLFGMGADDDWILNGQYVDRALYRDRFAYDTFRDLGPEPARYAPETTFCTLSLDGEERGIYTLGETLDQGSDRLDLDGDGPPGSAFLVKLDDEDGVRPNALGYGTWQIVWPDEDDPAVVAAVDAWLAGWEEAVLGPDPADPETGIFHWLDLDSAVDWVILEELLGNHDAYFLSVHLWKDRGGKMHFAPWDHDLSMGYPKDHCGADGWVPRTFLDAGGDEVDIAFVKRMVEVPAFRERLAERWRALRQAELSEEVLLDRIAGYEATLAPELEANFEIWPIEEIAFATDGVPNWLCPVSSPEEEQQRTRDWLVDRLAWMDAHIDEF